MHICAGVNIGNSCQTKQCLPPTRSPDNPQTSMNNIHNKESKYAHFKGIAFKNKAENRKATTRRRNRKAASNRQNRL
jgi:hypothetical protein